MRFSFPRFLQSLSDARLHPASRLVGMLAAGLLLVGAPAPAEAQVDPQSDAPAVAPTSADTPPASPLAQAIWSAAALQ